MKTPNTQLSERLTQPVQPNPQLTGSEARLVATSNDLSSYLPGRKALATVALMALGLSVSFAQVDEKRHFISLMGGISVPLSNYGATSGNNPGYAQLGSNFALESAFMFTKNIGIGASFGSFSNALDANALLETSNRDLPDGFQGSSTLKISRSYGNTYIMVGPNVSIPFSKSTLDFRIGVGSVSTSSPEITFDISNEEFAAKSVYKEAEGSAFVYSLGIGSRFNLSPKWALRVSGDFISAEPEIETLLTDTYVDQDGVISESSKLKSKYPISAYNFSIGIAYQFVK